MTGEVAARVIAEARLTDACVIRSPGADTFSVADGLEPVLGALVYEGPCKLLAAKGPGTPSLSSGEERLVVTHELLLPSSASASVGDRVTITGKAATFVVAVADLRTAGVLRRPKLRSSDPGHGQPG